eukprot:Ihof_evm1s518 gene=Ihof_evmTU1s518
MDGNISDESKSLTATNTSNPTREYHKPRSPTLLRNLANAILCIAIVITGIVLSEYALKLPKVVPVLIFTIQYGGWMYGYYYQTEHYYDVTGSITYLCAISYTLAVGSQSSRSIWASVCVLIWCIRLGSFLFRRISRETKDSRFDVIKPFPLAFLVAWSMQGMWVLMVGSPIYIINVWSDKDQSLNVRDYIGFLLWQIGFAIEVVADWQKTQFRADPLTNDKFIQGGLWSWSQHPNYFGEILLWVGLFIPCTNSLKGWQWLSILGPIFTIFLLTCVSGIPMVDKSANKKWGSDPDYIQYKKNTSLLVPCPP